LRVQYLCFVYQRASAITVNAAGRTVHHSLRRRAQQQRLHQSTGARIAASLQRRRCHVNDVACNASQSSQARRFIQIAAQSSDALLLQMRNPRLTAGQGIHTAGVFQQAGSAHTDVTATDDQYTRTSESRRQCAERALV